MSEHDFFAQRILKVLPSDISPMGVWKVRSPTLPRLGVDEFHELTTASQALYKTTQLHLVDTRGFSRIPRFIKEPKNTFFIMMIDYHVSGGYRADLQPAVNVFILLLAVASCIAGGLGHEPSSAYLGK